MTKEEARLTLQENLGYLTSVHHQRILDAIKVAIEVLSEFHFPYNLDEGTEEFTTEGIARPDDCEIWINFPDTSIKDGDKVIVQIRKKE